jgi:hypothetical protein
MEFAYFGIAHSTAMTHPFYTPDKGWIRAVTQVLKCEFSLGAT